MEITKKIPKISSILVNKKALSDYEIIKDFECAIKLSWSEVKSIRDKHFHLKSSFITIRDWLIFIQKMHISPFKMLTNKDSFDSEKERQLFLHKRDMSYLGHKIKEKWLTIIPTEVYFKWNLIKVKIALAKWKKLYEKRAQIKKKDIEMDLKISLANKY